MQLMPVCPGTRADLRVIAEHGYEGVASPDPDQRGQALSLFISDMLAARRVTA
jgi:hypothetical protein